MTVTIDNLEAVGNVVTEGYDHLTKVIIPRPALALSDAYLKWYDLHRADQSVHPDVDAEARKFIDVESTAGRLPIAGDLGFVINHLSGEHIHLLLVFTWRGNNEMWESAYYKDLRDGEPFRLAPQGTHRATICVWEFGAVAHEHLAWTRYLRSTRDEAAKRAYAESMFSGQI
jgi:hypothetical protein